MSWEPLQKGDLIDIVAPAWPSTPSDLKKGVTFLKTQFDVRVQKDILKNNAIAKRSPDGAVDISLRLQGLQKAFLAEDSKAIVCLRGGYGCLHLLPTLLKWKKPKKCKPLIGLSDISLLHYFVNKKWHWPSLHGLMVVHLADPLHSLREKKELLNILQGKIPTVSYKNLKPLNVMAKKAKKIEGRLIGGNLMTLQTLIGTPLPLQTKGKILFLEEVGERGYRIDRILRHIDFAGAFQGVKAIVLGQFLEGQKSKSSLLAVLTHFFASFQKPVFKGLPCGHGKKQRILPLNTHCVLQPGMKGWKLICQTGVSKL